MVACNVLQCTILLCACAYVATGGTSTAIATSLVPILATLRESGDETNGFPPGNEAEGDQLANGQVFSVGSQLLRLFTPQAALRAVKAWVRNCKYGARSQRTFGLRGQPHPHEYLH